MSDCANGGRGRWTNVKWGDPQPVLHLKAEFDKGQPWEYTIALNGRKLQALFVEGARYVPAPVIDWDAEIDDGR